MKKILSIMMPKKHKISTVCALLAAALLFGCTACARPKPPALPSVPSSQEGSAQQSSAAPSTEHDTPSDSEASPTPPAPSTSPSDTEEEPLTLKMPDEEDRAALTDWLWWLTNEDQGKNLHMAYANTYFTGFGRTTIDGEKRFTFSHGTANSALNTAIDIHDPAYPYVWKVYYRMGEEGLYHVADATPVYAWNENQNYRFEFSNYEGFRTIDNGFFATYHLIFITFDKEGQPLQWFDTVTQWRAEHEQWRLECET